MTEPHTEAGKALMRFMGWGPAWVKKILAIEREAAAGLLDQNDRLRSALEWALRNDGGECPADYPAGYAKALRVLRGSGAEEAARDG